MTPAQLEALLTGEWPPPSAHWPPNDKGTWKESMTLIGVIETTKRLPRKEQYAKEPGQRYTAVVLRRWPDGQRVTYHGYRTADEDLDGMPLDPGLLFGVVYRGEGKGGFEDFKHWTTSFTPPEAPPAPAEPRPERQPVTHAAQQDATATRNGRGAISRTDGPGPGRQDSADGSAGPPTRPEPGSAARTAALDDPYRDGVPTPDAIAAVRTTKDMQDLIGDAGKPYKMAVKQQGARRPPAGAGVWGAYWTSDDAELLRRVLTAAAELLQPARQKGAG